MLYLRIAYFVEIFAAKKFKLCFKCQFSGENSVHAFDASFLAKTLRRTT